MARWLLLYPSIDDANWLAKINKGDYSYFLLQQNVMETVWESIQTVFGIKGNLSAMTAC